MMPSRGTSTGKRLRRVKTRFGTSVASPCSGSSLDWTSSETRTIIGESLANHWCQLMMLMSAGVGCKVSRSLKDMSVLFCYILLFNIIQLCLGNLGTGFFLVAFRVDSRGGFPQGIPSGRVDSRWRHGLENRFDDLLWPDEDAWHIWRQSSSHRTAANAAVKQ